jgi:hypothetical protein
MVVRGTKRLWQTRQNVDIYQFSSGVGKMIVNGMLLCATNSPWRMGTKKSLSGSEKSDFVFQSCGEIRQSGRWSFRLSSLHHHCSRYHYTMHSPTRKKVKRNPRMMPCEYKSMGNNDSTPTDPLSALDVLPMEI